MRHVMLDSKKIPTLGDIPHRRLGVRSVWRTGQKLALSKVLVYSSTRKLSSVPVQP